MTNYEKLKAKLTEIFQLDQADLDFGIYRIMNSKRDEILSFLEKDLLPQVKSVLTTAQGDIGTAGAEELVTLETQIRAAGMNPDDSPKVQELRAKNAGGGDLGALEQEVFNHLYSFFRRYYDEGDFLSLRRYKEGVYAIPYEGEEVKLHWANADQYYIKTAEHFRDFIFKVGDKRVHFKLVDAQIERDNNKEQEKRVFILAEANPVFEEGGELIIRFEYRNDSAKRKQKDLTEAAIASILDVAPSGWRAQLTTKAPTDKDPNRTILAKRLNDYTARNTFDYFIHKDLGGFLRRELDFYIKNEVMHLDDIENEAAPKVEQYLAKVKAIRRVATKIIDFLTQLEEFQKSLYLKKKFVVGKHYLVTLNNVPEELYPEIANNDSQAREWSRLFAIDDILGDLESPKFEMPLSLEFLKANSNLVLDTSLFGPSFERKVLSAIRPIQTCGRTEIRMSVLVNGDNFQALNLLKNSYKRSIPFIYIDPPYNTGPSEILYKNDYKHSSWLSMMFSRLKVASSWLSSGQHSMCVAIDDREEANLSLLLSAVFPSYDLHRVVVEHYPGSGVGRANVTRTHEYSIFMTPPNEDVLKGELQEGGLRERGFRRSGLGDNNHRTGRPNSFFAVLVDRAKKEIVGFEAPPLQVTYPTDTTLDGYERIYPIGEDGSERVWSLSYEGAKEALHDGKLKCSPNLAIIRLYDDDDRRSLLPSVWTEKRFNAVTYGTNLLGNILGARGNFSYPKSLFTVAQCIEAGTHALPDATIVDFFAGSGTTGHAVLQVNKALGGNRNFILVEMGEYFDSVLKPRISKVLYADEWKDGKPTSRKSGVSHVVKVIKLESYEDTLTNLRVDTRTEAQSRLIESDAKVREDYLLRYVLKSESSGSSSLLDLVAFEHPFEYKLKVANDTVGETKEVNVDLVETFNWLLGLRIHTVDVIRGFHVVTGRLPGHGNSENGDKALIIWRDTTENPNEKLDEFFNKQAYNTLDQEFDVIYVNGDNNLQNLRKDDQTWKVRLTEEEFHRLMWATEDV